jgi:hypothetical protein
MYYSNLMTRAAKAYEETKDLNLGHKSSFVKHDRKVLTWNVIDAKAHSYASKFSISSTGHQQINKIKALLYNDIPPRRTEDYREMVPFD